MFEKYRVTRADRESKAREEAESQDRLARQATERRKSEAAEERAHELALDRGAGTRAEGNARSNFMAAAARYARKLPKQDVPLEQAVEVVVRNAVPWHLYRDASPAKYTEEYVMLARKHASPGEQVLGASFRPARRAQDGFSAKKQLLVLVTSDGFLMKEGLRSYRLAASETHAAIHYDGGAMAVSGGKPTLAWRIAGEVFWRDTMAYAVHLQQEAIKASKLRARTKKPACVQRERPRQQLIRSARDAELVAAKWMTFFGYSGVQVTPVGPDLGVDVVSDEALAQVKAEAVPTGRPKIQQHHGVAAAAGKKALFFSLAGYTQAALSWADEQGMALFRFDLQGEPVPLNGAAHIIVGR
jgi:Restriction endonuclease